MGEKRSVLWIEYKKDNPPVSKFTSHAEHEIYYFHEGMGSYIIGSKVYTLLPGDLIIMHGMTLHCANINPAYRYVRSVIQFDPSFIKTIAGAYLSPRVLNAFSLLKNYRIQLKGERRDEIEALLMKINHLYMQGASSYDRFLVAMLELLFTINDLSHAALASQSEFLSKKECLWQYKNTEFGNLKMHSPGEAPVIKKTLPANL